MIRNLFGFFKILFPQFECAFFGTTAAIIGGGLLAAGGSVAGSLIGGAAQDDATNASIQANREAMAQQERLAREGMAYQERQANSSLDFLKKQYADAQAQLAPFSKAQVGALEQAVGMTDPNNQIYQKRREQMTQQIQQQLAAQGLLRSKNQNDLLTGLELGLEEQRLGQVNALLGNGANQSLAGLAQNYGGNVAAIQGQLGQTVGSQFGAMGQNAMANGQSLANLNASRILAGAQNTQGLISGLTNIGSNMIGGFQAANQNALMNALVGKSLGITNKAGLDELLKQYRG